MGGCYLLWLGLGTLRHRRAHAEAMTKREAVRPPTLHVIRQGFMVGVLNPKSLVFFVAVFPHFVQRSRGDVTGQLLIFGLIFSVMAFCSDGTWGLIAGTAREWLANSPARLVAMRVTGACVMMTLGLLILITALLSA
jgi:threonine/homoserine/homoserine lactone efflux protein